MAADSRARPGTKAFVIGDSMLRRAATKPFDALRAQQQTVGGAGKGADGDYVRRAAVAPRISVIPTPMPTRRKLRIYTQDPATPRMDQPEVAISIPYEPLGPGPTGSIFKVTDFNESTGETYEPVRLDDLALTLTDGLKPSTTDPRFAQQMTYALAAATYERFRSALGRSPQFAFDPHQGDVDLDNHPVVKLHIRPHALEEDNAGYEQDTGSLAFGYTRATEQAQGLSQPDAVIFTSLSHDVVVHEMTHALLDGMRSQFMLPTHPDVDGFHEGFSDLIALFQWFSYPELVKRALRLGRGRVTSRLLVDLARQWGAATSDGKTALRTAMLAPGDIDQPVPKRQQYRETLEAHDMGAVLLRAVFDAFRFVFDEKTATLRALAPPGDAPLPEPLVELLAHEAARLADQFLNIVIRAVDYCPPVDLRLGEYLRAMITADFDLVPDDPWGYREALVRGFRRHGITVDGVLDLTQDALLWRGPERALPCVDGIGWVDVPQRQPMQPDERRAGLVRASAIGFYVTKPDMLYYFGLAAPSRKDRIERPVVESIRRIRRIGPDGNLNRDYVAEIIQRRRSRGRWVYGGSTVILDVEGVIRYIVAKNVKSRRREAQLHEHLAGASRAYKAMFEDDGVSPTPRLRQLHGARRARRPERPGD
jgi:hypothetical protein